MRWLMFLPSATVVFGLAWVLEVTQDAAPASNKVAQLEFPKGGYTFTLAEDERCSKTSTN